MKSMCVPSLFLIIAASALQPALADKPVDYAPPATWLCLPGRADACATTLSSTVVRGAGEMTRESYAPAADPPVDCFYVYPTVSREPRGNADMAPEPEIQNVAIEQFARFSARCRPYAPLYRQTTVAAMVGEAKDADFEMAYRDVLAAWRFYLDRFNQGRGVVLVGHSQGATLLARLLAEEIDGRKEQSRLLSAILIGTRIRLPANHDVGGTFQHVPVCRNDRQLQCVIAYSSYLAVDPPGATAVFGGAGEPGFVNACVNPAALLGHKTLDTELPTRGEVAKVLGTHFVENPGAFKGTCTTTGDRTYLSIAIDPDLPNGDRLQRSLTTLSTRRPGWGLHVFDVNLSLGDLIEIVGHESEAYRVQASH